jgi:CO/xanthine dehydrogenase Mo-binding subunit
MKKRGVGIASCFYGTGYGNGFPDVSKAEAELHSSGKIAVYAAAAEVGQGAKTIMSQIAAEAVGVSINDIILHSEDTSITQDSGTAAASRQTYNTGNAVRMACEKLRNKLIDIAAEKLGLNTNIGLSVKEGRIFVKHFPEKGITFKEIADSLKGDTLRQEATFIAQTTQMDPETGQGAPYWPYTFSCVGVEVEVDTETGRVEILRAVDAQDVGRAVNPTLVEGQMDGGFAMGYGYAIFEDINLKNGKMLHDSYTNYIIPTAMDMPEVEKIIIEDPESTAPYGAKGIGEPVLVAVAPAILNAIYNAVGVRITEIPVTPEKLLKAIKEKEKNQA